MKKVPRGELWALYFFVFSLVFLYLGWRFVEASVFLLGMCWLALAVGQKISIAWYPKRRFRSPYCCGIQFFPLSAAYFYSGITEERKFDLLAAVFLLLAGMFYCLRDLWRARHPDEIDDP